MKTYLPQVYGNAITGQADLCGMNTNAAAFAEAWLGLLGDRAARMVCDARLVACAQAHSEYLASRTDTQPSMHIGEFDSTPNQRVRASGYRLLKWHLDGNTVESDTRSWDAIPEAAADLAAHAEHRDHMMGRGFFEPSTVYGVGSMAKYFVCLAAPPERVGV